MAAGQSRAGSLVRSGPSPLGMVPVEGHREVRASGGLDHAGNSSAARRILSLVAGVLDLAATGLMAFTFRKAAARVAVILVVVILAR